MGTADKSLASGAIWVASGFATFYLATLVLAVFTGHVPAPLVAPGLLLGGTLAALSTIDARTWRLPDELTLPLAAAGVVVSAAFSTDRAAAAVDSIAGATAGLLLIVAIQQTYLRVRGRPGIGFGDAKLLAASGAWIGLGGLPSALLIACFTGLAFAGALYAAGRSLVRTTAIPFGPSLAIGTWLVWLFGPLV